ncbi:MAG: hypothetical protein NTZ73_02770 [Candidatus Diapherotrites archaeon]|nr:hypothetical protein [Candidatus Diapherotrites archaeon]
MAPHAERIRRHKIIMARKGLFLGTVLGESALSPPESNLRAIFKGIRAKRKGKMPTKKRFVKKKLKSICLTIFETGMEPDNARIDLLLKMVGKKRKVPDAKLPKFVENIKRDYKKFYEKYS